MGLSKGYKPYKMGLNGLKEAMPGVEVLANTIRLLYQGVFASRELADFEITVSPGIEAGKASR